MNNIMVNLQQASAFYSISYFFEHRNIFRRQCQTKTTGFAKTAARPASGSELTPLGDSVGAIELEILATVKVALLVEVVVN